MRQVTRNKYLPRGMHTSFITLMTRTITLLMVHYAKPCLNVENVSEAVIGTIQSSITSRSIFSVVSSSSNMKRGCHGVYSIAFAQHEFPLTVVLFI